jgi:hypothetical protein
MMYNIIGDYLVGHQRLFDNNPSNFLTDNSYPYSRNIQIRVDIV